MSRVSIKNVSSFSFGAILACSDEMHSKVRFSSKRFPFRVKFRSLPFSVILILSLITLNSNGIVFMIFEPLSVKLMAALLETEL